MDKIFAPKNITNALENYHVFMGFVLLLILC